MARRSMLVALVALVALATPAAAGKAFPQIIPLPNGFQPEGVAVGNGTTVFVGSIPTGAVWKGNLRTGDGDVFVPPQEGRSSIGLEADHRGRLFVAGGETGQAYVYDARSGASLAEYQLTTESAFINDVVVTGAAAWFTDSFSPVLHRVPLGPNGALPAQSQVETVPLTGDYQHVDGQFNVNGIDATPSGGRLVVVQSATGFLFLVDTASGATDRIELGGDTVTFGDGILLDGRTLYVVRNQQNRIAVVELAAGLGRGRLVRHITHPAFEVPTTIAEHGPRLYAVNARFGVTDPNAHYEVIRVRKR
jgi:sugar lactone lactonase YvrE